MPKQDITLLELITAIIWMTLTYTLVHEMFHVIAFWTLGIPSYIHWNATYPLHYPESWIQRFYVGASGGIGCALWLIIGNLFEEDEEDLVVRAGVILCQFAYGLAEGVAITIKPSGFQLVLNYGITFGVILFVVTIITYMYRHIDEIKPMEATVKNTPHPL